MQVFDADPLVGFGGSMKANWLVARTYFLQDIFVGCKWLDNIIIELAQFFSHQYSMIPLEDQEELLQMRLSLKEVLDEVGPVHMAAQQKMIDTAHNIMCASPAYKEMGMQILQLHDSVINIYNKHLGLPNWPNEDAAALQKLHLTDRLSARRLYTKSLCTSQDPMPIQVQVTPSGKKRRLDADDDCDHDLSLTDLDDLVFSGQ
ncbi:hypothetical protein DFJ58DRAFT_733689 [Suillus subalutaceus]|uniref:uncharacterized protein n=1 Tax=Suillus subalutaceus TaxID=48586 RepID=UPI001B871139|nr:uncharacterized protein DFJ58DRAFT_733689 [Suillus subalutaceus]KAG1838623.1 hypothetical protein DFJ58DRAFT_733689 [Suillus subalutaceus]